MRALQRRQTWTDSTRMNESVFCNVSTWCLKSVGSAAKSGCWMLQPLVICEQSQSTAVSVPPSVHAGACGALWHREMLQVRLYCLCAPWQA